MCSPRSVASPADLAKGASARTGATNNRAITSGALTTFYNALAPILAKHKLVITPRCLERTCVERQTQRAAPLLRHGRYEFVLTSAEDGSTIVARMFGEAMDSADKATNKAQSAAFKYMAMQQFCIPTEGDNDADATTHEVAAKPLSPPGRNQHHGRLPARSAGLQGVLVEEQGRLQGQLRPGRIPTTCRGHAAHRRLHAEG